MKADMLRAAAAILALLAPLSIVSAQEFQYASQNSQGTATAEEIQYATQPTQGYASAQEIHFVSQTAQATPITLVGGGDCCCNSGCCNSGGCDSCCNDGCCNSGCCCRTGGFYASAEALLLKSFERDGNFGAFGYDAGFRTTLGWEACNRFGARVRYFSFTQSATNAFNANGAAPPVLNRLHLSNIDLEATKSMDFCDNFNFLIGAGFRYNEFSVINRDINQALAPFESWTLGPVVTMELTARLSDYISLFAIGRQSILVGNNYDTRAVVDINAARSERNITTGSTEIQMGAQLNYNWNGVSLFGRVGWEVQMLHAMSDGNDVVLMGGMASIGIAR